MSLSIGTHLEMNEIVYAFARVRDPEIRFFFFSLFLWSTPLLIVSVISRISIWICINKNKNANRLDEERTYA